MSQNHRLLLLFILLPSSILSAQDEYAETSSWEPDDLTPTYSVLDTSNKYIQSPAILFANKLIKLYQQKISPNSISRCPFYISCSNFAYHSIHKYGLVKGICLFIDRHFYREHPYSFYYYGLREIEAGILKIDDSFYLFGDKNQ